MSARCTTVRVAFALVAAITMFAVPPLASPAANGTQVTFTIAFFFPGPSTAEPTITELGDSVVRVENVVYFGVGSPEALGDEAGATLSWLVNLEQERGTVWGSVTMANPALGLVWQGQLRGHITPNGAEGVIRLSETSTGQSFLGTWNSNQFVDPTASNQAFTILVAGTLAGP
jgi:hypothetical protein